MDLSETISASLSALGRRPAELLSWYVFGAAVPVLARTVVFLGLGASYLYLEFSGRLDPVREALAADEIEPPPVDGTEAAIEAWFEATLPHLEGLFTPLVGVTIGVSVLVALVVAAAFHFTVTAARITACETRLEGGPGIAPGIEGARRYWVSFLALFVLEVVLWLGAVLVAAFTVFIAALLGPLGVLVGFVVTAGLIIGLVLVRLLFAIAPVAVVVEDASTADGLRAAVGFLRAEPVLAFMYALVAVSLLSALALFGVGLSVLGAGSVVALLGLLFVSPFLDLLKTGLYKTTSGGFEGPVSSGRSLGGRLRAGLHRGLNEMAAFVRETPGLHAISAATLLTGFTVGYALVAPLEGTATTSIVERTDELVFGVAAFNFFANNWSVTLSVAFSGLAFAVPTLVSLAFNGVVFGAVGRLEVAPIELIAFVIPHGIFEIPAIIIAGAVGIWLGVIGWQAVRGHVGRSVVVDAIRRSFWILVGVGVVLAVAGFIEGVISPYYYRPFFS